MRDFKADQGLVPWVPPCLLTWSDANRIPLMETCAMYWRDLSKAGLTFKKLLPPLLRVISEAVGHKPHSTAAVVASPLVGARGDGADAAAAGAAHDDCETTMKLPIYKLTCRRITFWSENDTTAWSHPGWLLCTHTLGMTGGVPTSICVPIVLVLMSSMSVPMRAPLIPNIPRRGCWSPLRVSFRLIFRLSVLPCLGTQFVTGIGNGYRQRQFRRLSLQCRRVVGQFRKFSCTNFLSVFRASLLRLS